MISALAVPSIRTVVKRSYSRAIFRSFRLTQSHSFSVPNSLTFWHKTCATRVSIEGVDSVRIKYRLRHHRVSLLCSTYELVQRCRWMTATGGEASSSLTLCLHPGLQQLQPSPRFR
jgi:hypothetical protein